MSQSSRVCGIRSLKFRVLTHRQEYVWTQIASAARYAAGSVGCVGGARAHAEVLPGVQYRDGGTGAVLSRVWPPLVADHATASGGNRGTGGPATRVPDVPGDLAGSGDVLSALRPGLPRTAARVT